MNLYPSFTLFLACIVIGLGYALGSGLMSWVLGKLLALIDRPAA